MPTAADDLWQGLQRAGITQRKGFTGITELGLGLALGLGLRQYRLANESYGCIKKDQLSKVAAAERV